MRRLFRCQIYSYVANIGIFALTDVGQFILEFLQFLNIGNMDIVLCPDAVKGEGPNTELSRTWRVTFEI
jgi:hypothetical protein